MLLGVEQGVWREVEEVRVGDAGGEGFFFSGRLCGAGLIRATGNCRRGGLRGAAESE